MNSQDLDTLAALVEAARHADWMQVVLNQGPPCFHLEGRRFCLRAERWDGHRGPGYVAHAFVNLADLLAASPAAGGEQTCENCREKYAVSDDDRPRCGLFKVDVPCEYLGNFCGAFAPRTENTNG